MKKKGPLYPLGFSVSSAGTLTARLGQHRNSPEKQKRAQTSMPLILSFAESSDASEPIFATGTGRSPEKKRGVFYLRRRWAVEGKETEDRRHRSVQVQ
ncbi:MAG: hypothetical protein ACE5JO_01720 [Candidatus Binatia bacterium]